MKIPPKLHSLCSIVLVALIFAFVTVQPASAQTASTVMPIGKRVEIKAPLGLPPLPVPADNPLTEDSIALGRRLYYDPGLSVDGTILPVRPAMLRNLPFLTNVRCRKVWAESPGRGTRPQSSTRLTAHCNLGWTSRQSRGAGKRSDGKSCRDGA